MKTNIHISASQVGQRIKQARIRADISQQELGEKVFKTGAAIGYIERGKRGINVEDLALFAEVLNVPITFFFSNKVSDEQLLQETLEKLQKHISKLNQTISNQSQTINDLVSKLPSSSELRLISESSIDPILLISKKGKIVYATPSIYELIGIHNKNITGNLCNQIVAKNKQGSCELMLGEIFKNKKITNFETQLSHVNGNNIDIEINAQIITRNNEKIIHAVLRDISKRKQIEEELIENKEKYKQFLKQSSDGIYVAKMDGTVVEWNPAIEKITGMPKEKVIGKNAWKLLATNSYSQTSTAETKKFGKQIRLDIFDKQNTSAPRSVSLKNNKGEKVDVHVNFFPIHLENRQYVGGIIRDVTEQIKNKEELEKREKHWQKIIENMPAMIVAVNKNLKIVFWNTEAEKATGFTKKEILDNPKSFELLYPDKKYRDQLLKEWRKKKNNYRDWKLRVRCKNGKSKIISWSNISKKYPSPEWVAWTIGQEVEECD